MKASDVYKQAPRKSQSFKIGNVTVDLIEPSLKDQVDWSKISEKHGENSEYIFGFLISRCCSVFKGESPEDIIQNLDPTVLMEMGNVILGMVEKKKD